MYRKSSVFASSSSAIASKTEADYRQGMVPNTVAMAEDVNAYGMVSDKMNWTMSQEISNLLEAYGITLGSDYVSDPTNAANKMLLKLFNEKISIGRTLTGISASSGTIPVITQAGGSLSIPDMKIRFNNAVYYANTDNEIPEITITARTYTPSSGYSNGVYYLYVTNNGGFAVQTTPVLGSDGATKCFLGTFYLYNGVMQAGSWKYQPWLQVSAVEDRENPTAYTKGGYMSPASSSTLQMGTLEIQAEGINVDTNAYKPNIMTVSSVSPFTYKALYPGYNPGTSAISEIGGTGTIDVGTHIYNTSAGTWDSIKTWASGFSTPKYLVVVPCITPTGQTLMIPAMSSKSGNDYAQIYDSQQAAADAIYGMQYPDLSQVASRVIYLGVSLILRISTNDAALDLTNNEDFLIVGRVPQALAGFTSAAGQSGGGAGEYVPMKSYSYGSAYTSFTAINNAISVVEGNTSTAVAITLPTPVVGITNQVNVHYIHTSSNQGVTFTNATWWMGRNPTFQPGYTYDLIAEAVGGKWYVGYLVAPTAA